MPRLNPSTVAADLLDTIGKGICNALAITVSPPPLHRAR
jgi:hypothetical protein